MIIQKFFEALYPTGAPTQGYLSLWELPGKSSKHINTTVDGWREEVARIATEWDEAGKNVFYGVCLRGSDLGQYKRGSKKDIVCVPGLWVDIDLAGEGHAAKPNELPASVAEVVTKLLTPFGVDPSLVVHSAGGLHVYWLFPTPLILTPESNKKVTELSKDWQRRLEEIAKTAGYHLDMTADLSRVLRPAGTHNRKLSTPRPVTVLLNTPARYTFEDLRARIGTPAVVSVPTPTTAEPEILTENEVTDLARASLKRLAKHPERKTIIKCILKGEPFARQGERDLTLQKVSSWLGFALPDAAPETLAEVLRPSLEAMEEESPEDFLSVDDAVKKIERAQDDARRDIQVKAEEKARWTAAITKGRAPAHQEGIAPGRVAPSVPQEETIQISEPAEHTHIGSVPPDEVAPTVITDPVSSLLGGPAPCTALAIIPPGPIPGLAANPSNYGADTSFAFFGRAPYTKEELLEIAHQQALVAKEAMTYSQWKRRWIIQSGEYFYIFGPTVNGMAYQKPLVRGELDVALIKDLSLLPPEFFNWYREKADPEQGETRKKTAEVIVELGSVARGVIASMNADKSYFDSTQQRFIEVACPLRALEPTYDERVAKWLSLLGGESEGKLLDWLATITKLTLPSCALMITGVPDAGKSMLVEGVARLWTLDGPTKMAEVFSQWNADLQKCPLVVADEAVPENNGRPVSTNLLRDLISSATRPLHRKFMPNAALEGCLRVMFLANDDNMLCLGDENLGPDALAAVARRFLHVDAGAPAAEYLISLGGRTGTEDWVTGDRIAKHVLWLVANRQVVSGNRFLVEGMVSKMTQKLAVQGTVAGLVTEALARYLAKPSDFKSVSNGGALLIQDGKFWVNASALLNSWGRLITGERTPPTLQRVNTALAGISVSKEQRSIDTSSGRRLYWEIRTDIVSRWAEDNGIGRAVDIMQHVADAGRLKVVKETKVDAPAAPSAPVSSVDSLAQMLGKV